MIVGKTGEEDEGGGREEVKVKVKVEARDERMQCALSGSSVAISGLFFPHKQSVYGRCEEGVSRILHVLWRGAVDERRSTSYVTY